MANFSQSQLKCVIGNNQNEIKESMERIITERQGCEGISWLLIVKRIALKIFEDRKIPFYCRGN